MGTTPNYGLRTWTTAEYSDTFGTFVSATSGATASNMTIIDTQMKTNADGVASVLTAPVKVLFGEYVATSYYEATIASYSAYAIGNIFLLELDTTVEGATTINVNSIGTVSIMKYDSSGTLVNLAANDITAGQPQLIVYDGLQWIVCGRTSADQISATGGTVQSKLNDALYSTSVVDNLTSTSTNTPLSGNQGRVLNNTKQPTIDISGLLKGGGSGSISAATAGVDYADPAQMFYPNNVYGGILASNFDTISVTGFYTGYGTATGAPNTGSSWYLLHINSNDGIVYAIQYAYSFTTTEVYKRIKTSSTWGSWNLLPASRIGVDDAGGYYTSTTVEDALQETASKSWNTYTHNYSAGVHALVGVGSNIKFVATAGFTSGDTFTVNGTAVTLSGCPDGFANGDVVLAILNSTTIMFLTRRALTLWTGSAISGNITVPNMGKYRELIVKASTVLYKLYSADGTTYAGMAITTGTSQVTNVLTITLSGDTATIASNTYEVHTSGSTNATINTTGRTIDTIVGIM